MPMGNAKVIAVVIKRDGTLHHSQGGMTAEQAQRWADEGFTVFLMAARDGRWALNHVNTGKVYGELGELKAGEEAQTQTLKLLGLTGG